jgi:putative spermidine/putrescine transport system substrate-binding protein
MAEIARLPGSAISRRHLLGSAAGTAILTTAICSQAARASDKGPIIFLTWGGGFGKGIHLAFEVPFTKATGIEVLDVTPFNYGKFVTAIQNGNPEKYDIAWFDDEVEPARAGNEGLLEKLNYDWLPNAAKGIPATKQEYAVAPYITVYQIGYRTDNYKNQPPNSWRDFWDVEHFPGPRSLGTWVGGVLEAALMADGVPPDKLYPLDEARAFKMLDQLRPHIRVFHDTQSSQQVEQMLFQNEVSMVLTWSTDFIAAHLAGKPINVVYNQGFYFSPSVGIAKGSKYVREAHQFLNLFFDPDAELTFIKNWPTSPAVPEVIERMPEQVRQAAAISHIKEMVHLDRNYYLANDARLQQKYDEWRVG